MLRSSTLLLLLSLVPMPALSTAAAALRTFDTHRVRTAAPLDGLWRFELKDAADSLDARVRESTGGTMQVPGAWEKTPGLENYRGTAVYETEITAAADKAVRLVFGGVSHTGEVFIDGRSYGRHYDAYTPWAVVAPDLAPGSHTLRVEVDNSFGDHSALHIENDYYTWGGITRPVELQHVPDLFVERIHAVPSRDGGAWRLELAVTLRNVGGGESAGELSVRLEDGQSLELGRQTVPAGESRTVDAVLDCPGVEPWTADDPRLYLLAAELRNAGGTVSDDLIERVGFRTVAVSGGDILVNGETIRLRGFNRHEQHPAFGCAVPLPAMYNDLAIVRDLGGNFVRTSHYPNDMRFLDLCDELGIYVWEESHARNVDFEHPRFREQITSSSTEMVQWHMNHPSVIMWGSLNECDSGTPEGREVYGYVLGLIKRLDPSRPVTFASNRYERDMSLEFVDIVSWNIYSGWYSRGMDKIDDFLDDLLAWQDSAGSGGAGKPVIISEFGGGAIPGYRDPARPKWSEEYQADLLGACLREYLNNPRVSGAAVWQFCDIRITDGWWRTRPRTMNNKGVVDEFRRPKLSYPVVKQKMLESRRRWEGR